MQDPNTAIGLRNLKRAQSRTKFRGRDNLEIFENLITVEELAGAFGFAPQTIRNWVALRQIPFIRIGGKTRFRKGSIEAWLAQKETNTCP
jgi:excisionase family DNA binding protein